MSEVQETIIFKGVEYRLIGARKYYLSQSKSNEGRKHAKGLHVAIWEDANGREVPKGYCIHHKDGNTFNNDISNLECVLTHEHLSQHSKKNMQNPEYRKRNAEILAQNRDKASEWHRSKEGREWHSHNSKTCQKIYKTIICKNCGKEFLSPKSNTEFCSNMCGATYRRHQLTYTGVCLQCGKVFKYGKENSAVKDRKFCSRSCNVTYNNLHRKKKKQQ